MKNKLFQLMMALAFLSPSVFAANQSEVNRLGREVIELENFVTGLERDRDNFDRQHPDPTKWTAEDRKKADEFPKAIEKAEKAAAAKRKELQLADLGSASNNERRPAAEQAYEHVNGSCPFARDSLKFSPGASWRADGKLSFPKKSVASENIIAGSQQVVVYGHGVPFAPIAEGRKVTKVNAAYNDKGNLSSLELYQSSAPAKAGAKKPTEWKQTVDYAWSGENCSVKTVSVNAPELNGKTGVSYDRELCRALENKGLLDENKINDCTDFNERIGTEIEKATKDYGDKKVFALFTTSPSGNTSLREWKKKDHLSVNAAIARDCAFQQKSSSLPAATQRTAPGNDPSHNGTTAR